MLVWEAARAEAARLRREFQTGDPYRISRSLGIQVNEAMMPDGVSGMILKEADRDARIFVDASHGETRRRFTCAHELGHFVERTNIAGDVDFSFRDTRLEGRGNQGYNLHEFFADEFAGELLMPAADILRRQRAGASITTLASHFAVSVSAVETRLRRLEKHPPP